jgi:PncC family amidohydrolase
VAYDSEVKHRLLGVRPGPVVSRAAAEQMAQGAARAFRVGVGLATTGVVGPARQEGQPVGRVWVGVARHGHAWAHELQLGDGPPAVVRAGAVRAALRALVDALSD